MALQQIYLLLICQLHLSTETCGQSWAKSPQLICLTIHPAGWSAILSLSSLQNSHSLISVHSACFATLPCTDICMKNNVLLTIGGNGAAHMLELSQKLSS